MIAVAFEHVGLQQRIVRDAVESVLVSFELSYRSDKKPFVHRSLNAGILVTTVHQPRGVNRVNNHARTLGRIDYTIEFVAHTAGGWSSVKEKAV